MKSSALRQCLARAAVCASIALLVATCDSGNPVVPQAPAPPGSGEQAYQITLRAEPARVQAGAATPATIVVSVRQIADGIAPPDGTPVTVTVDSGSLGVNDPSALVQLVQLVLDAGSVRVSWFPGAETGKAVVLAQVGGSVGRLEIDVLEALPGNFFLSAVVPASGSADGGSVVTVRGAGFEAPLRVTFGGIVAQQLAVASDAIEVVTPPSAMVVAPGEVRPVDVMVTNTLTDPAPPSDTLQGGFIYTRGTPPPFFLTALRPTRGGATGGETITIEGGGFVAPVQVTFGGQLGVNARRISATRIQVVAPPPPSVVEPGTPLAVDVAVTHDLAEAPETKILPGAFTYDAGPPAEPPKPIVVSGISPAEGPHTGGTRVTITGQQFVAPVAVEVGGIRQLDEAVTSPTAVEFTSRSTTVGVCPADGRLERQGVRVTNLSSGEFGEAALVFTYTVPVPRISGVSPTTVVQNGGTLVTVTGEDFVSPLRVVFSAGGQELVGTGPAEVSGGVQVRSPAVPTALFPEIPCETTNEAGEPVKGVRYDDLVMDVQVINLGTGCRDRLAGALTVRPSNRTCRTPG